jgi:drug/metabolite transporter (DMT)-like permease
MQRTNAVSTRPAMPAMPMVFMLLAGASYGLISPLIRFEYTKGFSAADLTNAQYGIGFVIMWLIVLVRHRKSVIHKKQWLLLISLGTAAALVSICYYMALTVLPASFATILLFQFAWMATLLDIAVTRRLPSIVKWVGLIVILLGTVLAVGLNSDIASSGASATASGVSGGTGVSGASRLTAGAGFFGVFGVHGASGVLAALGAHYSLWAIGLGLLSAFFYTLTLYLSGYVSESISPELRSAIVVTVGMLIIFIPFRPTYLVSGALWHGLLVWGGLIAIIGQVAPMLLMLIAIPRIGGRMAAILGTIELPVSVFGAWLLNGDIVSWTRWGGVLFILLGIAVSESDEFIYSWWNQRRMKGNNKTKSKASSSFTRP